MNHDSVRRGVLFNQMAGPLFRQLAEGLASHYPDGVLLITGHPDTLALSNSVPGLTIIPSPVYDRSSFLNRLISWCKYICFVTPYLVFPRRGDSFILSSNPPLLGFWVYIISLFKRFSYAYLVYDIYPDVLVASNVLGSESFFVKVWSALNRFSYDKSKVVITICPRMAHRLSRQTSHIVDFIYPWADNNHIAPVSRSCNPYLRNFIDEDDFVILYSGNMGASHDISSILECAHSMLVHKSIKFVFIGDGDGKSIVEDYIQQNPYGNVRLYPYQDEALLPYTLSLADISIVSLDVGMEDLMVPSKLFYYLAVGSAILAITNVPSSVSDILVDNNCGSIVPPNSPDLLSREILKMFKDPDLLACCKRNSLCLSQSTYSLNSGLTRFVHTLQRVGIAP